MHYIEFEFKEKVFHLCHFQFSNCEISNGQKIKNIIVDLHDKKVKIVICYYFKQIFLFEVIIYRERHS